MYDLYLVLHFLLPFYVLARRHKLQYSLINKYKLSFISVGLDTTAVGLWQPQPLDKSLLYSLRWIVIRLCWQNGGMCYWLLASEEVSAKQCAWCIICLQIIVNLLLSNDRLLGMGVYLLCASSLLCRWSFESRCKFVSGNVCHHLVRWYFWPIIQE